MQRENSTRHKPRLRLVTQPEPEPDDDVWEELRDEWAAFLAELGAG